MQLVPFDVFLCCSCSEVEQPVPRRYFINTRLVPYQAPAGCSIQPLLPWQLSARLHGTMLCSWSSVCLCFCSWVELPLRWDYFSLDFHFLSPLLDFPLLISCSLYFSFFPCITSSGSWDGSPIVVLFWSSVWISDHYILHGVDMTSF